MSILYFLFVTALFPCNAIAEDESTNAGTKTPESERASPVSIDKKQTTEDKKESESDKEKSWGDYLQNAKQAYAAGKLNEAASQLELSLSTAERMRSDGARAEAFLEIGEQYLYLEHFEKSKSLMEEGLKLKRKIPGFKTIANANALDNLAQAYSRTGDLESASKLELEALSTYQSLRKTDSHDYAIALSNHANTLRQLKQYKEAEQFFAKAVAVQQKIDKGESVELAKILLNAGGMYCETNKLDSAKRLLDRASSIIRSNYNAEHPLYKLSIKSERVLYKKRVDDLLKKDANPVRPEVAQAVLRLASLYESEGDATQAAAAYKQAIAIQEKLLSADSPELAKIKDAYDACMKKLGN